LIVAFQLARYGVRVATLSLQSSVDSEETFWSASFDGGSLFTIAWPSGGSPSLGITLGLTLMGWPGLRPKNG
jgi:hypothetical protein